jgi:hypothetical protein
MSPKTLISRILPFCSFKIYKHVQKFTSGFDEHSENGFLQRVAEILRGELARLYEFGRLLLNVGQQPREGHVHAFHRVRQLVELLSPAEILNSVKKDEKNFIGEHFLAACSML